MATQTSPETDGFGTVSRTKGILFKGLAFVASIVGILALGVLLVQVFWDAFGLDSAGLGWYATFLATMVVPTLVFVGYARRKPVAGKAGLELVSTAVAGLLLGIGAVIILLVIASAPIWFAYFLSTIAPVAALYAYGQYDRSATWVNLAILGFLLAGPVAGTLFLGWFAYPGVLLGAPGVQFLTLVVPGALVLYHTLANVFEYSRRQAIGGAVALPVVAAAGVPLVDQVVVLERSVWFTLLVMFALPFGVSVANSVRDRARRMGFVLPAILVGGFLVGRTIVDVAGFSRPSPWFDWQFLTSSPSTSTPAEAGLYPAIVGSVFLISLVAIFTFIVGVGAALYLEEYAPSSGLWGKITRAIQVNISNLAGVPSVVYGLLGLGIFVNLEFALGPVTYGGFGVGTVLSAAFTLSLLILPIVIISAQEAIRSVPDSLRQASYGMGATKWQTTRTVVLPRAIPGILTGTILALGRAIGETAPLLMIGVATTSFSPPSGLFSTLTAMPMQIFAWAFLPGEQFRYGVLAAGVVALLIVLLTMNSIAILLRNRFEAEA